MRTGTGESFLSRSTTAVRSRVVQQLVTTGFKRSSFTSAAESERVGLGQAERFMMSGASSRSVACRTKRFTLETNSGAGEGASMLAGRGSPPVIGMPSSASGESAEVPVDAVASVDSFEARVASARSSRMFCGDRSSPASSTIAAVSPLSVVT